RMRPETEFVRMDAEVETVAEGRPVRIDINAVAPRCFTIRGQIPIKRKPLVRVYPVEEPAAFARALFIEALRHEGVTINASVLQATSAELPERGSYAKMR